MIKKKGSRSNWCQIVLRSFTGKAIRTLMGVLQRYWWGEQWGKRLDQTSLCRSFRFYQHSCTIYIQYLYIKKKRSKKTGDQRSNQCFHFQVCLGWFPGLYGTFQLWWDLLFHVNTSYTLGSLWEIVAMSHGKKFARITKETEAICCFRGLRFTSLRWTWITWPCFTTLRERCASTENSSFGRSKIYIYIGRGNYSDRV